MTKKERTIKACRELAAKYRKPEGEHFFRIDSCPLCPIHNIGDYANGGCRGCPLSLNYNAVGYESDKCGAAGCNEFSSHLKAENYYFECRMPIKPNPAFEARAAFFDKIIPIFEKIPASRFTKRGWKYFKELDRSW